jgi:CRP-like cAMP-binding protein
MNHFTANNQSSTYFDERQILSFLPIGISREISLDMYYDVLGQSPLFKLLGTELMLRLCEAVTPVSVIRSQTIFKTGDVGHEMYFIVKGEVEVTAGPHNSKLGFIGHGGFFGEQTIIEAVDRKFGVGSCVRGRTISATTDSDLAMLETDTVLSICESFPELEVRLRSFKRVGTKLGGKGQAAADAKSLRKAATIGNLDQFIDSGDGSTNEAQRVQGKVDGDDIGDTQSEWMQAGKRLLTCSNGDLKLAIARLMGACSTPRWICFADFPVVH